MQKKTLAVVGFGELGARLPALLSNDWDVVGLRRRPERVSAPARGVRVDLADPSSLQVLESIKPDALLITLSPDDRTVEGYIRGFAEAMENIVAGLGDWRPERAYFVSSTRVYAESSGGRVAEDSDLAIDDPRARAIIQAETCFAGAIPNSCILRAAGLYSNEPGYLLRRVAGGELSPATPLRVGNRIHREDVVGFIAYSLAMGAAPAVVNLVDKAAVPIQEVEAWLCKQIGADYSPPDHGDTVRGHKTIDGARLLETGYTLQYPNYRTGYLAAIESWKRAR